MDYFREVIHFIYLAKKLQAIGKLQVIEYLRDWTLASDGELDFDLCLEGASAIIDGVFEYISGKHYEKHGFELMTLSDKVIVDYYMLAGEYGKRNGFNDRNNPYFQAAEREAEGLFYFSYSISCILKGHSEPRRPFHSRMVLVIYDDEAFYPIETAIGVISMYHYFSEKCDELRELLSKGTDYPDEMGSNTDKPRGKEAA